MLCHNGLPRWTLRTEVLVKIIHTSDWHIGRRFERHPLEADQRAFLGWLAAEVEDRGVDLVIIAGDIYDRAMPSEEAVAVLDDGIDAIRAAGAEIALISGNHDSARRLGFGARRQAMGGVHVFADERNAPVPKRLRVGDVEVALLGIPFLDPALVSGVYGDDQEVPRRRSHESVLVSALDAGRANFGDLTGIPSIAIAHAFVAGSQTSDSEKTLAVGGADHVDAGIFGSFDYVALGHIHRPQTLGAPTIAYSGSPLAYSYSEEAPKSVRLIDVSTSGIESIENLPIPIGRPVATLTDSIENLISLPTYDQYSEHWVAAELTDETTVLQPLERLQARFPFATTIRYRGPGGGPVSAPDLTQGAVEDREPSEVVLEFLSEIRQRDVTEAEEALVVDAVNAAERSVNR